MTIDTLTVGEFRRLMHYDGPDSDTVAQALERIAAGDQAQADHEAATMAYNAYVARRDQRRDDAVESAALKANRAAAREGDGAKMAARRNARVQAHAEFEDREPLLAFQEWIDAGRPDTHAQRGVFKRAAAKVQEVLVA